MANEMRDTPVEPINAQGGDSQDPKVQEVLRKAKGYETVLKTLIHGDKTRDEVINMLKAGGDAMMSVPQAAMSINDMGLQTMKQGGINVEPSVQLVASSYLIDDLMQLGEAAGAFQIEEGMMESIFEDTFQMYVERGLGDGSIDPIQLQLEAEKAMTEEQAVAGITLGHGKVPQQPNQQALTEQYANRKVRSREKAIMEKQSRKETQQKQTALAQSMAQQGGPQNG